MAAVGSTAYVPVRNLSTVDVDAIIVAPLTVREKWRRLHWNCRVISIYGFFFSSGWSIWERNLFPVFFADIAGTAGVGYIQSLQGLVALVAAPLVGLWMDRSSRVRGVRTFAVGVGVVALSGVLAALAQGGARPFYPAMAAWGLLLSAQGILADTTLANSSAPGPERQFAFVAKATLLRLGNVAGQAVNLVYFAAAGDSWESRRLRRVMAGGAVLCLASVFLLGLVKDVGDGVPRLEVPAAVEGAEAPGAAPVPLAAASAPWYRRPPVIILAAVTIRVVGKGASMRFIPVFLKDAYGMRPTALTAIVLAAQALSVLSPFCCDALSRRIGAAPTMVVARLVEPAALGALGVCRNESGAAVAFLAFLAIPVGSRAIEKAVLMDYAAPKSRGRWNAVEAVNRGTWAGSSALGGYLVGRFGYPRAFLASAACVGASVLVLSSLLAVDALGPPRRYGK